MSSKIGILGYGEIGKAIAKFYQKPRIRDLEGKDDLRGVEVLHICIPWSKDFVKIAKKKIKEIRPKLTFIHSTVKVGTTRKIGVKIVHSPVRGKHPNLYSGIKTFINYLGADDKKTGKLAQKHLTGLGIRTKLLFPSKTTEALKLWDTAQYGWFIVLNKEIKKWCVRNRLNFDIIYKEANKTYNEGYLKLKRPEVQRPWLKFMPGEIGGHCIIPNCYLLDSQITRFILKKNESYKKNNRA